MSLPFVLDNCDLKRSMGEHHHMEPFLNDVHATLWHMAYPLIRGEFKDEWGNHEEGPCSSIIKVCSCDA